MRDGPDLHSTMPDQMVSTGSDEISAFNLNEYVPFLINRGATRVAADFGSGLKPHGINITVWRIIASLNQHESQRIGELSDFTGIEMWTVSRVVTRLEQDGYVTRHRGDQDARGVIVSLTETGRALVDTLIPEAQRYESLILEGFSEDETKCLRALLDRLFHNMRR
ncbi:MarR family transcriptional regulator [Iodidimonas sp. SYSU 1G8]|uniref:MarR family winged helix-turn-helix transcriptional regulator n=1 Tax=Iodidimonas sp. SYSU 1G8 TaxID=3133967 RepID=UPI0031FE8CC3